MRDIIGVNELSGYLNIKEQTIYKLIKDGKIPAIKFGGQWKVKSNHIDQMFEKILAQKLEGLHSGIDF